MAEIRNLIQQSVELSSWQEIYFQQSRLDSHEMKAALDLICRLISGISSSLLKMGLLGTKIMHDQVLPEIFFWWVQEKTV